MSPLARLFAILLATLGLHSATSAGRISSDIHSITIHNNVGVSVTVTKPADVAAIVRWFDGLPHFVARPCPLLQRTPPKVRFEFRGADGRVVMRATARRPGTCSGEITYSDTGQVKHAPLSDRGFVARVSKLVDLTFDPNARTELNKIAAQRDVTRLIEHIRVPAGSRLVHEGVSRRYADAGRTWKVHMYFEDVFAFVRDHRQPGSSEDGSGAGSLWGHINERDLFLTFPSIPHRIESREIDFHFSELPGGWTRFSASAGDQWVVARSPNEKVPAGVTEIVVHGPPKLARRFTRPAEIAQIVHWFNSLPVGGRDYGWCTIAVSTPYPTTPATIDFLDADGTTLARVDVVSFCGSQTLDVSIRGHHEATLDAGSFLDRIEHLPDQS